MASSSSSSSSSSAPAQSIVTFLDDELKLANNIHDTSYPIQDELYRREEGEMIIAQQLDQFLQSIVSFERMQFDAAVASEERKEQTCYLDPVMINNLKFQYKELLCKEENLNHMDRYIATLARLGLAAGSFTLNEGHEIMGNLSIIRELTLNQKLSGERFESSVISLFHPQLTRIAAWSNPNNLMATDIPMCQIIPARTKNQVELLTHHQETRLEQSSLLTVANVLQM